MPDVGSVPARAADGSRAVFALLHIADIKNRLLGKIDFASTVGGRSFQLVFELVSMFTMHF